MASNTDVSNQFEPSTGKDETQSTVAASQEQAAGVAQSVQNNASIVADKVAAHPITQSVVNGPAATSVKKEAGKTGNEFSSLAGARKVPEYRAANDTPLTHYHSFFWRLLSWQEPRATGITFASLVVLIFAGRYLNLASYVLRLTWTSLGVVTLAEASAKFITGSSVASSVRPRRYYKIPKESLEATLDDVEQLINFFVIEIQRIVFAENVPITAAAFTAVFASYWLIRILPFWGMLLLGTSVSFLGPLVYVQNKELIDSQLTHASNLIGEQTTQLRDLTAQHTSKGLESVKTYTGDYASKASEYIGKSRQKIPIPATSSTKSAVNEGDFPQAPKTDLPSSSAEHTKPAVHAPVEGEPIAASSI